MLPSPVFIFVFALFIAWSLILMRSRRFYFIRHGETVLNAEHIRQGEDGALSEKGRHQAKRIGEVLKRYPIERIISSTYQRTRETTAIINEFLKVPVVYSTLLVERRNPKEIIGKPTIDLEVMHIVDQMDLAYHEDDFRISDEENFADLKERAHKCLDLFERQGAHETVVVTHHHFLKMIIAYLLYRERLHAGDFTKLSFFNTADNAGMTVCSYHPWKRFSKTRGWKVESFNETF